MSQDRMVVLGVITGAHGVKGRVKIKSYTEDPYDIVSYGSLFFEDGTTVDVTITGSGNDHLLAEIEGITSREAVQTIRGKTLSVPRSALPDENDNEDAFYIEDLMELNVLDAEGQPLGSISKIFNHGAGDIIEISFTASGKKELFPFKHDIFPTIALSEGNITFIQPEMIMVKEETSS